jgi:hypothetical protein
VLFRSRYFLKKHLSLRENALLRPERETEFFHEPHAR